MRHLRFVNLRLLFFIDPVLKLLIDLLKDFPAVSRR